MVKKSKSMFELFREYDGKRFLGLAKIGLPGYGLVPSYISVLSMDDNVERFNEICDEIDVIPDDELDGYLKKKFNMRNSSVRKSFISEYVPLRNEYRSLNERRKKMKDN